QPRHVVSDQRERLVEVDGASDRLADVGHELELLGVALRLLVEPRGLDRDRQLPGGGAQRLDLAPVGPPLVGAVVPHLEDTRRPARLVAAEGDEDANEVFVPAALEDLAGEREWGFVAGVGLLPDQAGEHLALDYAVAVD